MATVTFKTTNVQDTYIESSGVNTNHNGDTHLYTGDLNVTTEVYRSLIKFPVDDGTIPAGSVINSATLRLYKLTDYADNTRTLKVYRLVRAWVESEATWNKADSSTNWGTAGAGNQTTDIENTTIGTRSMVNGEATGAFADITLDASKIQEMIASGVFTNKGFMLAMDVESNDGWEFTSNASGTTAQHPELVIDYTPNKDITLTDTITIVDTTVKALSRTLSETVILVDTFIKSLSRTLTDVITLEDTLISKFTGKLLIETITLVDTVTKSLSRTLTDVITLVDTFTNVRSFSRTYTETIKLRDNFWWNHVKAIGSWIQSVATGNWTRDNPDEN